MSSNGIYFAKQKQKWIAQCRMNGKNTQIGAFDTPEEASMAYVTHKLTVKREPTPSDYKRLERYKAFTNYCKTPRTISELFALYPKANTSSIRFASDYLVNNRFLKKTVRDRDSIKDKYLYETIKDFQDADLKPMGRSTMQKIKFDETMTLKEEQKINGAVAYSFDSGTLREKYTQQRIADRLSAKMPKVYVSGNSLSHI